MVWVMAEKHKPETRIHKGKATGRFRVSGTAHARVRIVQTSPDADEKLFEAARTMAREYKEKYGDIYLDLPVPEAPLVLPDPEFVLPLHK
jgi:hypothetical protein